MNELECEGENVERCGNGYTHECMQNMEARKFFYTKYYSFLLQFRVVELGFSFQRIILPQ